MHQILDDFLELFYPRLCIPCGRKLVSQEKFMCLDCQQDLPRTQFHLNPENKVAQLFWGRVYVEFATAWLYFRKGSRYQRLIHYLKYKGLMEIGEQLGIWMGDDLTGSPFRQADIIVPVPLHRKREKERGYNQSEWIAKGISAVMQKPLSVKNLVREQFTTTQTRKNRFERWQNVEGIFQVINPEEFIGKHILIIDDVITTGSTLEAAVITLQKTGAAKVSIATLACAEI